MSFKVALDDPAAPTGKETQFYAMLGTRGIWHKGWFANTVHAATPAGWSHFDKDRWELFHIEADRSQCHDLAAEQPDKLEELKALWFSEADKYNGLPLADLNILETMTRWRPYLVGDRSTYTYYPDTAEVGMGAAAEIRGRSFAVFADVTVDTTGAEGVLFKHGGAHGGHVLFIQDGRLHYVYNFLGEEEQKLSSPGAVPLGKHMFGVALCAYRHGRQTATPRSAKPRCTSTTPRSRSLPDVKTIREHSVWRVPAVSIGRNTGSPVSQRLQGAVRVHRWHHRSGHRRRFGRAVRGSGTRIRTGFREGLMNHSGGRPCCWCSWRHAWCLPASGPATACPLPVRTPTSTSAPSVPRPTDETDSAAPGVMPTTRAPIPPNTVTCSPAVKSPVTITAQVADPQAPKVTIAILDGWSASTGTGDVGARLGGPNAMSTTVTIAATQARPRGRVHRVRRPPDGGIGGQQCQRHPRPVVRVQRAEADGRLVGHPAECGRVRRPHRPRLDKLRGLSGCRARGGADRNGWIRCGLVAAD